MLSFLFCAMLSLYHLLYRYVGAFVNVTRGLQKVKKFDVDVDVVRLFVHYRIAIARRNEKRSERSRDDAAYRERKYLK